MQLVATRTSLLLSYYTLAWPHHRGTAAGWWCLFIHFSTFISIQHTCKLSPQTLFYKCSSHLSVWLTTHWITTVYTVTHNVLLASPGCRQKVNKSQQTPSVLIARLPNLVSFLTHIFTVTHSLPGNFVGAWPIRFPDQSIQPITKGPITLKFNHFLDQSLTSATPTPTPTCSACVCQMFWRLIHLRGDKQPGVIWGAPSSHRRGVNLFKMVLPTRAYDPSDYYESCYVAALWSNRLAWCHQSLATGWSLDTPDTVAPATQWLPGFQGTESWPRWLNEGRKEE